ncbi:hypothetical protein DYQ95_12780 [Xanthomonas sp. LMG 9002]|nr:hypothetical protein [Xanthomonas sp. LMG 9002]
MQQVIQCRGELQVQPALLLLLLLLLIYRGPLGAAAPAGKNPKGGAHGRAPFAAGAGCPFRESPSGLRTRSAQRGGRAAGCAFFWLLFFAQAKKSNSPSGESLALALAAVAAAAGW